MKIYYRDIVLFCLILIILIYYYVFLLILNISIYSFIINILLSYIIIVYYILIAPIFYYFSILTIDLFISSDKKDEIKLEFIYDSKFQEYDIRIIGKRYYFRLDKLYSSYLYETYKSYKFREIVSVIDNILKECDKKYDNDSHLIFERKYYIESYITIIILGVIILLFFLYNIFFIG